MGSLQPGGKRRLGEGGSFTYCHPVAAPHMRRDCSPGRCRNKKGLSGCSPAEPGSEMCVALCGGGCRAGSGKAKLIPLPQEMKGVPSQEFRR